MARPPYLSPSEAKRIILQMIVDDCVVPTYHYNRYRKNWRTAPLDDVINALETGQIKRKPEWDEEHQNWEYRVEGFDIEGDELIAITAIIESDWQVKIITVFG
jgi:hypothetical protein